MPPAILKNVVFPTLARADLAVIAISTLDDPYSPWVLMMEKKLPNGEPLFYVVKFSLVCADCAREGIMAECEHNKGDVPPWLSVDQIAKLRTVLEDDVEALLRETMGHIADMSSSEAFDQKAALRLKTDDCLAWTDHDIDEFYIWVDPSGRGTSRYAMVSFCIVDGRFIVSILLLTERFFVVVRVVERRHRVVLGVRENLGPHRVHVAQQRGVHLAVDDLV